MNNDNKNNNDNNNNNRPVAKESMVLNATKPTMLKKCVPLQLSSETIPQI